MNGEIIFWGIMSVLSIAGTAWLMAATASMLPKSASEKRAEEEASKNALRDDFGPSETTSGTVRLVETGELGATPFAVLRITDREGLPDIDVVALGQHSIDRFSGAGSSEYHSCKRVPRYFVDNLPVVTFDDTPGAAAA